MYGWINDCLEKFLTSKYGNEFWSKVMSGILIDGGSGKWIQSQYYDDQSTYIIMEKAAFLLGIEVNKVTGLP
jgi:hypothetical protein